MNIKRAFFAAVAVLMMPGFAMAQSTYYFDTMLTTVPGGDHPEVDVTITCNGGLPLSQSATTPVTFVVTELMDDAVCEITVDSILDSGWEYVMEDPCLYNPVGESTNLMCDIEITPAESVFEVTVDWTITDEADPAVGSQATVDLVCFDALYGSTVSTSGLAAGPGTSFPVSLAVTPNTNGMTECFAYLNSYGSAVEVDGDCDDGTSLTIGGGAAACTIEATAFYEGIPTLSQYGMAIMALLMLGVGFIGFRRFV